MARGARRVARLSPPFGAPSETSSAEPAQRTIEEVASAFDQNGCTASERQAGCNATAKRPLLQHPMNCITKAQAERSCVSQGKRLPSAPEWEFAARGTDGRIYPWGNDAAGEQLCWQGRAGSVSKNTCPVGSFANGASPFGALDMAGNVAEWTSTEETETVGPGAFRTRGGSQQRRDVRRHPTDQSGISRLFISVVERLTTGQAEESGRSGLVAIRFPTFSRYGHDIVARVLRRAPR